MIRLGGIVMIRLMLNCFGGLFRELKKNYADKCFHVL